MNTKMISEFIKVNNIELADLALDFDSEPSNKFWKERAATKVVADKPEQTEKGYWYLPLTTCVKDVNGEYHRTDNTVYLMNFRNRKFQVCQDTNGNMDLGTSDYTEVDEFARLSKPIRKALIEQAIFDYMTCNYFCGVPHSLDLDSQKNLDDFASKVKMY
jgi:hypothetical protein